MPPSPPSDPPHRSSSLARSKLSTSKSASSSSSITASSPSPFSQSFENYVFTPQGWSHQATGALLRCSTAVDSVCHAIVATKKLYESGPIAKELRQLALTVAVLERSLFSYADRIRQHKLTVRNERIRQACDSSSNTTKQDPESGLDSENKDNKLTATGQSINGTDSNMTPLRVRLDRRWRHTGGTFALLSFLAKLLVHLRATLHQLIRVSSFNLFIRNYRKRLVPVCLCWAFGMGLLHRYARNWISKALSKYFSRSASVLSVLVGGSIPLTLISLHRFMQSQAEQELVKFHSELWTLLRHWHFCHSSSSNNSLGSSGIRLSKQQEVSSRLTTNESSPVQTSGLEMPISQWMLGFVPPPLSSCIWYRSTTRLALFSHCMNTLHSTVSFLSRTTGLVPNLLSLPVGAVLLGVYGTQPQKTQDAATIELTSPDVTRFQNSWKCWKYVVHQGILSWSLYQAKRRLATYVECDTDCLVSGYPIVPGSSDFRSITILSNRKLSQSSSSEFMLDQCSFSNIPNVIFSIHGGPWSADFIPCDMRHLCEWALVSDAVIVSLDFSKEPVRTFLEALEKASAIYQWIITGGLGFSPRKVAMFGDGGGATVAISLALKLALEMDPEAYKLDGLVLSCPPLDLRSTRLSTSKSLFMMDPVVPQGLLQQCQSVYVPSCSGDEEMYLCPSRAPDWLLRRLPSVYIVSAGLDPFLDDSVEFCHRLAAVGKACHFRVFSHLPHNFLALSVLLPSAVQASRLVCHWLLDIIRYSANGVSPSLSQISRSLPVSPAILSSKLDR